MIVPMKKATLLFETGDAEATVRRLRTLGVLHVEHQNLPEGRNISQLQEEVTSISSFFDTLNRVMASGNNIPTQETLNEDWVPIVDRIIEHGKRLDQLESSSRGIVGQINEWDRWGDIDLDQVHQLRKNGIILALYQVPVKEIGTFPDDVVVRIIFTAGDIAHCVAISRRMFECPFIEIVPPKQSVSALKTQLSKITDTMESIRKDIIDSARFRDALSGIKRNLEKEIEFQQVLSGMGTEGKISYVTGYIPFDMEEHLVTEAKGRKWGIMVTEPSDVDEVPTLIRNPKWISLIKPVLNLLGLTPGYKELDISFLFLIFFGIFFGILIGDAGYGLAYILITLVLQKIVLKETISQNPEMKTTFSLFYILGSCAFVWGLLTGTFFGQSWFLAVGYRPLVPALNDTSFMQSFCFFLGALHLSIAHSWRAVLKYPSLTLFADIGWICVLWTAFFLARTLILGEAFPTLGIWLVATGIVLVILFTNPQANVARGIGEGLGTVALSFMNNITDVISYIRLFAVGLATLAIAETTNTLAFGFGEGVVALIAGVVILISGHCLNIILGPISVLVHGVRLNVLEFSGHANVTWSGTAFEPLKD